MSYIPAPPPSARPPNTGNIYNSYTNASPGNGTFVSVPTTPLGPPTPKHAPGNPNPHQTNHPYAQHPSRHYEDITLHSHSPYSIQKDNHLFWLQQIFRTRMGLQMVVLIASIGCLAGSTYVLNTHHETISGNGLWRDLPGWGGVDMSPVVVLIATGSTAIAISSAAIGLSLYPKTRKAKGGKVADWIALAAAALGFCLALAAIVYTFSHPSLKVTLGEKGKAMSFRKYTCDIKRNMYKQSNEAAAATMGAVMGQEMQGKQGIPMQAPGKANIVLPAGNSGVGDPMQGVDARAVVLFTSMCGQYNLSWVLVILMLVFEIFIIATVPFGIKYRKGLEKIEEDEVKLMSAGKF